MAISWTQSFDHCWVHEYMISNNILKANTKSKAYKQPIKQNNSGIIHVGETSCKVCMT